MNQELKPRKKRRASRSLSADEVNKLKSACHTLQETLLLELMIYTGMRRSDIVALQVNEINLVANEIQVAKQQKTKKSINLSVTGILFRDLKLYIYEKELHDDDWLFESRISPEKKQALRKERKERIIRDVDDNIVKIIPSEYFYPVKINNKGKTCVSTHRLNDFLNDLINRAHLTDITPHDFRATFFSKCAEERIDPKIVSDSLGVDIRTVLSHYDRPTHQQRYDAIKQVQDKL